ncbi:hypothetical protein CIL03_00050 [Virgibacillus indicus]|uniref:DAGKc domain-containing protein n=1 Tax=Virgibacillus indicus TaxID=2024554 RepID=A0A265NDN8_9BACI|nr:diacylglycerol kinase family protein [Virgibacillus indicus]OZU89579.1 hypothetical protein CIL03_00050 [Virgibacillus indicus]
MYIFIVNPEAGNGRAKRVFTKLMKSQLYQKLNSTYFYSEYAGHAEMLTKQIKIDYKDQLSGIIVIGGDGTLHEVMNGLGDEEIPVSFIPGGSGNDFARGIGMKRKPLDILRETIAGNNTTAYWLGKYKLDRQEERIFVNSMGFGFDAEITEKANRSRYKVLLNKLRIGTVSYVIALIHVLLTFKPEDITIEADGKRQIINNCWMVTVSNHPYYGGGMKIIPNAKIQSGRFPVLIIHGISKWKVLGLFMTVFTGKHIDFKEVELLEASTLKLIANRNIAYQVDGQTASCREAVIKKETDEIYIMGHKYSKNAGA